MKSDAGKEFSKENEAVLFERLIAEHYPRVYRVLLRLLDASEDAEDVAQEVMLAAWGHRHRFRGEAAFSTWLHRIAVNRAFSVQRSLRREASYTTHSILPIRDENDETDPVRRLIRTDASSRLREAVSALPEKQRLVATLHYYGEAETHEIACALGIAEATVRSHLRHAHRRLRALLKEEWSG